jgi:hypothetical protein
MFRSVLVDATISNTDEGKQKVAKAILAWNEKSNASTESVDASLRSFLEKQGVDVLNATAVRDKLIQYARASFSNLEA